MTPSRSGAAAAASRHRMAGAPSAVPARVLREYALLADGERGAVVGPRGEIVWLCAPRWDSDAVFSALIGGGSAYSVTPQDRFVWGGYYEEGSMIWRGRWTTETGFVECRDALTYPGDTHRAVLLRRVHALDTDAAVNVTLHPRAGFDQHPLRELHRHDGIWTGRCGDLYLRWSGARPARARQHGELLVPALRGAIPPDDPRTLATLDAYLDQLTVDGYAYRFRHDDRPLAEAEGSFLLCGFLVALSHHQHGDQAEAHAWFERTRAACGPAQLFGEEYDATQHQMRGNLPQAFVHALMIETATRLAR